MIDSVPGSFTSYTDSAPPTGPLYYAIETLHEEGCSQGSGGGNDRSRSNVQYTGTVGIEDDPETGVKIFPNPAHDILNIHFSKKDINARIIIYTSEGKTMILKRVQQEKTIIDLGSLNPGVYIIRVEDDHYSHARKLVVY